MYAGLDAGDEDGVAAVLSGSLCPFTNVSGMESEDQIFKSRCVQVCKLMLR